MPTAKENLSTLEPDADQDRRKFMATCGKFAVVTPPAITMLLSTSLNSTAIAQSGGRGDPGRGWDHDHDHGRGGWDDDRRRGKDHDH